MAENEEKVSGAATTRLNIEDLDNLTSQALYHASLAGNIIRINKAFEELTGYTNEELAGRPITLLFASEEEAGRLEEETVKAGGTRAKVTLLSKNKKELPLAAGTSLAKDDQGNATGYVATFAETSQSLQRFVQAALQWRASVDAITDLVWICDKDCSVLRSNMAYATAVGIEPRLVVGNACRDVFPWAKVACTHCPQKKTMATGEPATQEFYEPELDAWLEISASPILDEKRDVIASVCVARDITNRKRADKQIQSLNRLTQYFSPDLAERLMSDEDLYKVRRKNLTIFFVDIRGFTRLSDEVEPEELLKMLNEFFEQMTATIFKYGGTVGKFIGDAIMGFFGDPEERPDHAERCVKMALEMQAKVRDLNRNSLLWSDYPLAIGIGINTGYVTVGNVGSESHKDYTIIGRHVNLAARLEEEAKPGQVLVSNRTYRLTGSVVKAEEVGNINVKGFDNPVLVYNVLGLA